MPSYISEPHQVIIGEDEKYVVNMGPQHPSTHGVLKFELTIKGETIVNLVPHCGYIHRGIEKNDAPIPFFKSDWYMRICLILCVLGIFITGFVSAIFEYILSVS